MTDSLDETALRSEIVAACGVLTRFRIVEGFGHVSARLPGDRLLITPRTALGLVREPEIVEMGFDGQQLGGTGRPPLEWRMHLAVFQRRPDVAAICRGHPRHVAAFASAAEPIRAAHGFGANLGAEVPVFGQPFLVATDEMGQGVADALGQAEAVILQANGMLAVGQSVPHACVQALFLEEMAEVLLLARGAGLTPKEYTPETAARRHGDDRVHEPIRAWEYYLAVTEGRLQV